MQRNTGSQKLYVYAYDSTTNAPKTGDAANITAYVTIDYGTLTTLTDTGAAEVDNTKAKGYYVFDLTAAETNGDVLLFSAKSATSNIVTIAKPDTVFTKGFDVSGLRAALGLNEPNLTAALTDIYRKI